MRHILPFYKEEELIEQNLPVQTCLEMKFEDKQLVRCLAFAKHRRRLAIDICQEDIAAGIFCVLTESETHFTIWREQPPEGQKVQKVSEDGTPVSPDRLKPSQSISPNERRIASSQLEDVQSAEMISPPIAAVNDLAVDSTLRSFEPTVEFIDISSQSADLQHQSALSAAPNRASESPTQAANTSLSNRSAFLALFNQELTQHIGPIADFLINDLLAKRPKIKPQQLLEAIVAEIPDPQEAAKIRESLGHIIHQFKEAM